MSKPWPSALKRRDPKPSTYGDLSVETNDAVVIGDQLYFVLWCHDMDDFDRQTSILFRANVSFDEPAERLAAIDSEVVGACAHGGELVVLENAVGPRGGCGIVHRLAGAYHKPKSSTRLRTGSIYKTLRRGGAGTIYAAGDAVHWLDGNGWKPADTPAYSFHVNAVASNGALTVAVGEGGLILTLANSKGKLVRDGTPAGDALNGVDVGADGIVSIAGAHGTCLQGPLDNLGSLGQLDRETDVNDCCAFKGNLYWSTSGNGDTGGVYVQAGRKLARVFGEESCWRLVATDDYLFAASEEGIARFDGEGWKLLRTKYDAKQGVWSATGLSKSSEKRAARGSKRPSGRK